MFPKIILFGNESRTKMLEGINILANSVKSTLGPQGRNVVIAVKNQPIRFTKDGVSVAKEVCLEDAVQDTGVNIIKEVALNTCDTVGDGTTTATVIAQNIINQGMTFIEHGYNPMDLKRGIDIAIKEVEKYLRSNSIDISTDKEIINIATIACNGDRELGELIANTFKKVGKEGVITLEESTSGKTEMTIVEGLQLDKGFISPYFVTNPAKMTCELENPYILVYDKKISTLQPMLRLLDSIVKSNESLLIIAEDVDSEALGMLVLNHKKNGFKLAAIKSPSFGNQRIDLISDLSVMTGSRIVSEDTGIKLENIDKNMLGRAKKVIISAEKTIVVDGLGNKEDIQERCEYLKNEIESSENAYAKAHLQERLAKLTNGIAVIKVGGIADFDIKERKDRVEDAIHATRAALQEGILPGGGMALFNASFYLLGLDRIHEKGNDNESIRHGIYLIECALKAPLYQILENAGLIPEEIRDEFFKSENMNQFQMGYDALNFQYVNMIDAGIIDPTKVVITAFKDAASIAGLLLTTEVALVEENEITLNTVQGQSSSIKVRV
jgi:chaperonin GroEL